MHRSGLASAAALVVALAFAACGGDDSASNETQTAAAPSFPSALAEELALVSDDVADLLEAGDGCAAAERAAELRRQTLAAVDAGDVPPEFEQPLLTAVDRLGAQIVCEPASGEDDEGDDDENGNPGKGKAKGKDKGNGGEDSPDGTTETTETTETAATTTGAG